MNKGKTLLSIGAAAISTKLARTLSGLEFDDVLRPLGLSRRHSHWPENLAFLGVGVIVGGITGLMLAPSSGRVTRERFAKKADELSDVAIRRFQESTAEIRDDADAVAGRRNGETVQAKTPG
jgi:hypothetical protein